MATPESTMTTAAPWRDKSSAIARPMPRAPPVTIATRFWRSMRSALVVESVGVNLARREALRGEQRAGGFDHHRRSGEIRHGIIGERQIDRFVDQAVAPAACADLLG